MQVGKLAPAFRGQALVEGAFKDISLNDFRGKYLVLFFYPLDFSYACSHELYAFSNHVDKFRALGCEVLACSCSRNFTQFAWVHTQHKGTSLRIMDIPFVTDKDCMISRSYGVYQAESSTCYRGLFIIDPEGVIRHVTVNDFFVPRSVNEILRLIQALQTTTNGKKDDSLCQVCHQEKHQIPDKVRAKDIINKISF